MMNWLRQSMLILPTAVMLALGPSAAHASSVCGSNWCSGADGSSTTNEQGNAPQVYIGEIDTYTHNFGNTPGPCPSGPNDHMCFVTSTAANAASRWRSGGGLGNQSYYFGGGANSTLKPSGLSAYCWGADQGFDALWDLRNISTFDYHNQQRLMFLDIEQDPNYGWANSNPSGNRQVFNGFYDYLAGSNPCGIGVPSNKQQPGVYSSPNNWSYAMGGVSGGNASIPNTYAWTTQVCCTTAWPGAAWGGSSAVQWFGGSNYDWARQFYESNSQDWDDAYAPDKLPALGGEVIGN